MKTQVITHFGKCLKAFIALGLSHFDQSKDPLVNPSDKKSATTPFFAPIWYEEKVRVLGKQFMYVLGKSYWNFLNACVGNKWVRVKEVYGDEQVVGAWRSMLNGSSVEPQEGIIASLWKNVQQKL